MRLNPDTHMRFNTSTYKPVFGTVRSRLPFTRTRPWSCTVVNKGIVGRFQTTQSLSPPALDIFRQRETKECFCSAPQLATSPNRVGLFWLGQGFDTARVEGGSYVYRREDQKACSGSNTC